jgi:hypothetical protein
MCVSFYHVEFLSSYIPTFTLPAISSVARFTNTLVRSNLVDTLSMLRTVVVPETGIIKR